MHKTIMTAALLLLTYLTKAQENFTIKARTGKSDSPGKAYLFYRNGRDIVTDSALLHHGAFTFTGSLKEPTLARLIVDHQGVGMAKTTSSSDMIMMYLEKGIIQINGADSVKKATITGSAINKDYARYQKFVGDAQDEKLRLKQFEFIKANPDSYVSLYTLRAAAVPVIDVTVVDPLFNGLSRQLQESITGREFKELIDKRRALEVGQMAPVFTQNDVNDRPVSLTDFRGKYVLIDFWASWCKPCRAENPYVVRAYNTYKDKGFTVLSVSLDRPGKKEDWLKAIEKDSLTWTHVSDLQFWDNAVAKQYGVKSVPQNYLLNKEGKIVAENLRGEALLEKLKTLMQ